MNLKILLLACLLFASEALAKKPDPKLTPGYLCTASDPNFSGFRYPSHVAICFRNIGYAEKQQVAAAYGNIPESQWSNYEFDHLIPLSIGGSDDIRNLWPEPIAEAKQKDQLEDQLYHQLLAGTITQGQAIMKMKAWVDAH